MKTVLLATGSVLCFAVACAMPFFFAWIANSDPRPLPHWMYNTSKGWVSTLHPSIDMTVTTLWILLFPAGLFFAVFAADTKRKEQ